MKFRIAGLVFILVNIVYDGVAAFEGRIVPPVCTYEVSSWNVKMKRAVDTRMIQHPYSEIRKEEIDPQTGCTVCREDQVEIKIADLEPFFLCYKVAPQVRNTLEVLIQKGEPFFSIRGYRVIRSRGSIDERGNRTALSNHSFGTAFDINREFNGLYDKCYQFGPQCRLILGGHWRPGIPGTLEKDSAVVKAMKDIGFDWGGEIEGKQKDFMHFSYSGY